MRVWIKGAGDLASGIACRLHACGFSIVMTELPVPTTVRRTVAFSPAVYQGEARVEGVTGVLCQDVEACRRAVAAGYIAVMADPAGERARLWEPQVVVDAIIAKRNMGTSLSDAPVVIGVGPGFTAGEDCQCVVETMRGHDLGRCLYRGSAQPNTGVPGEIGGYTTQRILRAPAEGIFRGAVSIGDTVQPGQITGYVGESTMRSQIGGVVRGLLQDGVPVWQGMKAGDVDPRCRRENCFSVSDKARAIGGGVLEALLHLSGLQL
ncbi:MAG: selenium-dependent molybdenum cofactor biosynthesis protein YqeB [Eubacteriales bacterium]|jgi:xanthine dehydrogenase accessory factor